MYKRILGIVSLTMLIAACSSDGENSVTGGYGNYVLSGQIFAVGNLSGSSSDGITTHAGTPAVGVEVRARGTGLASVSSADGRFSLSGLPASVQLTFTRSDGVNASAQVNVAASPVVTVELQKTQANVIPNGQAKREIEGLILAIAPDKSTITVNNASSGPVTVKVVTGTAIIRHGNTMVQVSQLKVGDRVHVRALINDDNSLTALEIILQNPADDTSPSSQLEGLILAVSCSEITVNDASKGPTSAKIDGNTRIRRGNTNVPCGNLNINDRVHVKASRDANGDLVATEIILQNPA
jgi:hypothetical protein